MIIKNIKLLDSPEGREQCNILVKKKLLPLIYDSLFGLFAMQVCSFYFSIKLLKIITFLSFFL